MYGDIHKDDINKLTVYDEQAFMKRTAQQDIGKM